ncbi:hypothetical protein ACLHDG_06665 [Sulfurovum sp. CS9]|uniref:hypothetical protein n=1 Tax=Sulfurovum sp. CS9 TaxID=3391146 RepID=UPI0039E9DF10
MKYEEYQYIAKELAVRHDEIKTILDTATDNIISPDSAKTLLSKYFIAIGELKIRGEGKMSYIFDINHFRIQPIDNELMNVRLRKTIDGLKLSSLLNKGDKNPLYWYDQRKQGLSWYAIAKGCSFNIEEKEIKKQVMKLDEAINTLRYRELVS